MFREHIGRMEGWADQKTLSALEQVRTLWTLWLQRHFASQSYGLQMPLLPSSTDLTEDDAWLR